MSEATRGLESTVALTLEPRDGGTLVTPRHAGLPDDELGRRREGGWQLVVGAIAEGFASRAR